MKSYIDLVSAVYGGILRDATTVWPNLHISVERDYSRLLKELHLNRGLPFFTMTLPEMGKVFDQSLAQQTLLSSKIPQGIKMRDNRPELFGGLLSLVFDGEGRLMDEPDICAIAYLRQLYYTAKKLKLECKDVYTRKTIKEFFDVELTLPMPSDNWFSDEPTWGNGPSLPFGKEEDRGTLLRESEIPLCTRDFDWSYLRFCADRIAIELGYLDSWELIPRHGPGAVSEAREFVTKYEFPNWPRRLDRWFPFEWFGSGILDHKVRGDLPSPTNRELPSRLIAVPKTQKGPRLICAEPLAHQWIQQGIRKWLEGRIDRTVLARTITFRSQENSRKRALDSSLDGRLATIDLSSASDRMSCQLVEYIFRANHSLLDAIHACRTRYMKQTIYEDIGFSNHWLLRKFATQGTAITFPIQSIVFAVISIAAVMQQRQMPLTKRSLRKVAAEVTVFGDDIIVPSTEYEATVSMLEACGLRVNPDKSFSEGNFRESCGCDAFMGHDVTPAYILSPYDASSAESIASIVEVSNNFYLKGMWHSAASILDFVPSKELELIPIKGNLDEGGLGGLHLVSYMGNSLEHLNKRYSEELHRYEYKHLDVTSKVRKVRGGGLSSLTQYFTENPNPDVIWESGQARRAILRKKIAWAPAYTGGEG